MEQYQQYVKKNQPTLILFLIVLCLVLIGGVTYDTVLLNQTKTQATQANTHAQEANYNIRSTDQDVQNNGTVIEDICLYNNDSDPNCTP